MSPLPAISIALFSTILNGHFQMLRPGIHVPEIGLSEDSEPTGSTHLIRNHSIFSKGWRFQILYFQYIVQFAWDLCHCLHDWSLWELRDQFDLVWPQKYHECLSAFPTLSISPKWTIVKLLKRWLWSYWKGCPTQNRANWNFIQSNVWWCSWCSRFCTHLWCPEVKNMPEPIPICCQRSKAATFVESYERT